jgi:hypothetical protein
MKKPPFALPDSDVRRLQHLGVSLDTNAVEEKKPVLFSRKPLSLSLINDGLGFGELLHDEFLVVTEDKNKRRRLEAKSVTFLMTTSGKVEVEKNKENP